MFYLVFWVINQPEGKTHNNYFSKYFLPTSAEGFLENVATIFTHLKTEMFFFQNGRTNGNALPYSDVGLNRALFDA